MRKGTVGREKKSTVTPIPWVLLVIYASEI